MTIINQINEADWDEFSSPVPIAVLPLYPDNMAKRHGILFFEYNDAGLGLCRAAFIKINEIKYFLHAHPEGPAKAKYLKVSVRSFEPDSEKALIILLDVLELKRPELIWKNQDLGPAGWILSRLDDNGNEFEMRRFLEERTANYVRQEFENKGHKQTYFVRRKK